MTPPFDQAALSAKATAQTRNADIGIAGNPSQFAPEKLIEPDAVAARSLTRRETPAAAGGRFFETYDAPNRLDDARIAYAERAIIDDIAKFCPEATSLIVTYSGNYDVGGIGRPILNDEFGNAIETDADALHDVIDLYGDVFEHEDYIRRRTSFEGTGVDSRYALPLKQDRARSLAFEINSLNSALEAVKKQKTAAAVELIAEIVTKVHPTAAGIRTYQDDVSGLVTEDGTPFEHRTGPKGTSDRSFWDQIEDATKHIVPAHLENVTEDDRGRFVIWF
jgi:hypothetical protein